MRRWYLTAALIVVAIASSTLNWVRDRIHDELNGGRKPIPVKPRLVTLPDEADADRVVVVVDTSASMTEPGVWERLGPELLGKIGQLPPDTELAIVGFADDPQVLVPFQRRDVVLDRLAGWPNGQRLGGGSDLGAGLSLGLQLVGQDLDGSQLWVVSDGAPNLGALDPQSFVRLGDQAESAGVTVVLLGDKPGYLAQVFEAESHR